MNTEREEVGMDRRTGGVRARLRSFAVVGALVAAATNALALDLEKDELKFGFIKLTDCAALVIAK